MWVGEDNRRSDEPEQDTRTLNLAHHALMRRTHTYTHDYIQACLSSSSSCHLVDDAFLHPNHFRPDLDRLIHHWGNRFTSSEDQNHVNFVWDRRQIRVSGFSQDFSKIWIDRINLVSLGLERGRERGV